MYDDHKANLTVVIQFVYFIFWVIVTYAVNRCYMSSSLTKHKEPRQPVSGIRS